MPQLTTITFSEREYDTLIAALRLWQSPPYDTFGAAVEDLSTIACEHGPQLTVDEIETLVDRMQISPWYPVP